LKGNEEMEQPVMELPANYETKIAIYKELNAKYKELIYLYKAMTANCQKQLALHEKRIAEFEDGMSSKC
jgi:alkylhydroperoxidase/carboxymuconolactone decarboxylase family protein YurZ